jgi:putative Mg2+ transporter-C (MgtC) family protein
LPARTVVDAEVCWERREASPEPDIEAALRTIDGEVRHDSFELIEDGRIVRRKWRLKAAEESQLKRLAERLCAIPGVIGYSLDPRDD